MKILSIIGSLRQGNTSLMVNTASKAISSVADVEIINLRGLKFSFCNGCLQCDETGSCCFDDDMTEVIEKIKEADGLIIGTPTRWGLLSGELKCFFDRLNPLATTEILASKKAIIFAVGQSEEGTDDANSVKLACKSVKTFCENADIEVVKTVCAYDCLEKEDILNKENVLLACEKAAKKLANAI